MIPIRLHPIRFLPCVLLANIFIALLGCKPQYQNVSDLSVVNGNVVESEAEARQNTPGAYGIQMTYENAKGEIKQQEASGFFTDQAGTTFITNRHVTQLNPPAGYKLKGNIRIVDFRGNTIQEVTSSTDTYVNIGSQPSGDLAMWRFPQGTKTLPHGSARFSPPGYDLTTEDLRLAGYGTNTNSASEKAEYQKLRYGPIPNRYIRNADGQTFNYYGPRLDSDSGSSVSSAPGDSGGPIYGSGGIVGINRGGKNIDRDSSYSEGINPYSPAAKHFFSQVQSRGGVVEGWVSDQKIPGINQVTQTSK